MSSDDGNRPTVRVRQRQRPTRILTLDEPGTPRPDPPPQLFMPSGPGDRYEFTNNPLPTDPGMVTALIVRFSETAAIEDRHRAMQPLMARRTPSHEIARLFNVSIPTADRWKKEYRDWIKKNCALNVDPLSEYAEAIDQINMLMAATLNDMLRPSAANETLNPTSRRLRCVRMYKELIATKTMVNQAYGVAYEGVLEKEKLKQGQQQEGDTLISMVKELAGAFSMEDGLTMDALSSFVGGGDVIDGTI